LGGNTGLPFGKRGNFLFLKKKNFQMKKGGVKIFKIFLKENKGGFDAIFFGAFFPISGAPQKSPPPIV